MRACVCVGAHVCVAVWAVMMFALTQRPARKAALFSRISKRSQEVNCLSFPISSGMGHGPLALAADAEVTVREIGLVDVEV